MQKVSAKLLKGVPKTKFVRLKKKRELCSCFEFS